MNPTADSLLSPAWLPADLPGSSADLAARHFADLVERSRHGCHEAYRELVEHHRDRIFRFCLGWTGSPEDAEELCQDVFVRAYSALPRFLGGDRFAAWLFRIARNRCRDHYRSRGWRQTARNRPLDRHEGDGLVSHAPQPDERVAGAEELEALRRAIASLPERLREVLVLCGLEGLSQEDCAALLGCSRRAVEGRLYRARTELADRLGIASC